MDPNISEIRIVFDRPMQPDSYSVMMGDKAKFPKLNGEVHYDSSHTVFIIPVSLKPDWDYSFGLNSKNTIGFKDKGGNALYPVVIKFKTGK